MEKGQQLSEAIQYIVERGKASSCGSYLNSPEKAVSTDPEKEPISIAPARDGPSTRPAGGYPLTGSYRILLYSHCPNILSVSFAFTLSSCKCAAISHKSWLNGAWPAKEQPLKMLGVTKFAAGSTLVSHDKTCLTCKTVPRCSFSSSSMNMCGKKLQGETGSESGHAHIAYIQYVLHFAF